jgi:hypothetical protein
MLLRRRTDLSHARWSGARNDPAPFDAAIETLLRS